MRRHRLLETFLARVLDVPWDEVHAEAELLEHALTDRLEERIDATLGHPTHDPHGDPIPPRDGPHDEHWGEALDAACRPVPASASSGSPTATVRPCATSASSACVPGVVLTVEEQAPFGGPRWVRVGGRRQPLGGPLTRVVYGHVIDEESRVTADDFFPRRRHRDGDAATSRRPPSRRSGRSGRVRGRLPFFGPAFVAAIAYVDPGNFATNFSAGAEFGYLLLWVIVAANLLAMLIQTLSAKLGLATGTQPARSCAATASRAR